MQQQIKTLTPINKTCLLSWAVPQPHVLISPVNYSAGYIGRWGFNVIISLREDHKSCFIAPVPSLKNALRRDGAQRYSYLRQANRISLGGEYFLHLLSLQIISYPGPVPLIQGVTAAEAHTSSQASCCAWERLGDAKERLYSWCLCSSAKVRF